MKKGNIKLGITKVKRLMKRHLRLSRKKKKPILKTKTEKYSIDLREKWIRLYLKLTNEYNSSNVLSMDETAWHYNMNTNYSWSTIGEDNFEAHG